MKTSLIRGVVVLTTLLSLVSCCPESDMIYKESFKYKIGDFVVHRVSGDTIMIVDTIRQYDCNCTDQVKIEFKYVAVSGSENENVYREIEIKK